MFYWILIWKICKYMYTRDTAARKVTKNLLDVWVIKGNWDDGWKTCWLDLDLEILYLWFYLLSIFDTRKNMRLLSFTLRVLSHSIYVLYDVMW